MTPPTEALNCGRALTQSSARTILAHLVTDDLPGNPPDIGTSTLTNPPPRPSAPNPRRQPVITVGDHSADATAYEIGSERRLGAVGS
jgi:hypothetical protein